MMFSLCDREVGMKSIVGFDGIIKASASSKPNKVFHNSSTHIDKDKIINFVDAYLGPAVN
jgi:hypothetical protein